MKSHAQPTHTQKNRFMAEAIRLARKGAGMVSPNPLVGAVIVKNNEIVGRGYHGRYGGPHAEVSALQEAGENALGADLYVNLEPCCHFGKTPPCTDVLIKCGIKRAFIGIQDPNPLVGGKGLLALQKAGIEVETGILADKCRVLNETFIKYITYKIPFVTLKLAATLDGKIATVTGDSQWISGEAARRCVHRLRYEADAVMVGIGTVIADNPLLTNRYYKTSHKRNPQRFIIDSRLRIPLSCRLLKTAPEVKTVIATTQRAPKNKITKITQRGAEVIIAPAHNGHVNLKHLMKLLAERGISSVVIEGGAELGAAALLYGIVDKVLFFFAPKIIGGRHARGMIGGDGVRKIADAIRLSNMHCRKVGNDLLVEGYVANY
jgi:diaminohydroxyphosphoribosylaminopyrimidine deaminase/5-amino-6-(5-phosphoribosylamino)uracil reductase